MLHSIIFGDSSSPSIIILHGLFGESKNWVGCANILSNNFEVHLLDLRNHGNSFHSPDHNYEVMAMDVKNYIIEHNLKNFSMIGHSMGGKVAMQYACSHDLNSLNKLIIVDIAPKEYLDDYSNIFNGLDEVLKFSKSRKSALGLLDSFIKNKTISNFLLKSFSINNFGQSSFKFNINSLRNNIKRIKSNIKVYKPCAKEVYFLDGEYSNYIDKSDYISISKIFTRNRVIIIPKAGHWIHHENKKYFIDIVNKCLLNPELLEE